MSVHPIKLAPDVVLNLASSMTGSVALRGGSPAQAGMVLPAPDGDRFLYQTAAELVVYILVKPANGHHHNLGQFFSQGRSYFASDVELGAVAAGVARRTAATKKVMEAWVDLMMGAVGCASGPVGWAVTGFNLAMNGANFYRNYDIYVKAIERILYHRTSYKSQAPTLYSTVLEDLLFGHIQDKLKGSIVTKVSEKVAGKGVGGKLVGLFLGKMGEDYFKRNLKAINSLFKEVLIKIAQHMYDNPGAKLSEEQIDGLAGHVRKQLAPVRQISTSVSKKIVQEVAEGHLRSGLIDISNAISALP